jgi:hypothetical protein
MEQRNTGLRLANLLLIAIFVAANCFAATAPPVYSKMSNPELKAAALRVVKDIRDRVDSYNKKDKELTDEYNKNFLATRTDERKELKSRWLKESDALQDSAMRSYGDGYRPVAISLIQELYRRLPSRFQGAKLPTIYQNPTNVKGLEAIADHLELTAKSLPDS